MRRARAMGDVRRILFVTAAVVGAIAVAIAAGVDATDFVECAAGWLVRTASPLVGFIGERTPRGSWASLGLSLLLDAFLLLAFGPAGPVHRRLAGACGASAKAAFETARRHGIRGDGVDVVSSSGSVTASAVAAFAESLGTLGTGIFVSVVFALFEGWRASRVRARRAAANVATRDLSLEGIRRLANVSLGESARAPSWACDVVAAAAEAAIGDVDTVRWWNNVMATAWPNVSTAAQSYVRSILEPMLDHHRPPGISEMKFDTFNLGESPPEISSVAIIPPDEPDEIQIQLRVQWRGTPNVVFKVSGPKIYGGMSPVKMGMTDLTIAGTAKVTLAHLMRELPVVGGLQVTLTEDPTVTYKVAVKAAPGMPHLSLSSIPGLKAAVSNAVVHALRDTAVFPKSVAVNFAEHHTPRIRAAVADALRISPVGRLTVTVVRARGLRNSDFIGTSDPYVCVALGSRKVPPQTAGRRERGVARTRSARNDLSPAFDETFALDVMSTELQSVWIRVFDDDGEYSAHDHMGTVVLPLAGLPAREDVRGEYALKSATELDGAAATRSLGSVELVLRYEPVEDETAALEEGPNGAEAPVHSDASAARTTPFRRSVSSWLGARDARGGEDATSSLLRDDDGSLRGFDDATVRMFARHTLTRMDVGGGIPLWAASPDFSRVAFLNEILLVLWPYAAEATRKELSLLNEGGVLRDHLAAVLGARATDFFDARARVDIGRIPPTIEGVRVRRDVADEIVAEWSVKITSDGFAGFELGARAFPNARFAVTAGEGQLLAVIRARLRPLVPHAPIVAGVSVSFVGTTVVDGRLDVRVPFLPRLDVLSLPPFALAKAYALGPMLRRRMRFPAAIHTPVLDFEHPAVKQLTSATSAARAERHALEISVLSARNLDAADAFGTSDPFCVVALAGEGHFDSRAKKTSVKKRTLNPKWFESFTYVVTDPKQARDVLFVVFDSDGKTATARAAEPERVRAKIAPVKALHLRALEVSERYLYRATRIPWAKKRPKKREPGETRPGRLNPTRERGLRRGGVAAGDSDDDRRASPRGGASARASLWKRMARARVADIARRARDEPPPPVREETEEECLASEKAARRAAKLKRKSSSKSLSLAMDTKKNLAAFNPNRVVSDVEACVVRESVMGAHDLLGAAMVDFAEMCGPGETARFWLALEGCPGDAKRAAATRAGTRATPRAPPELEIELAWRTYDAVDAASAKAPTRAPALRRVAAGDPASAASAASGSLRVDVSHASDLYKPRSRLWGKMSGAKLTPKVILRVGATSAETSAGRTANPGFREGFDFFGVTALDELVVEVVHPGRRAWGARKQAAPAHSAAFGARARDRAARAPGEDGRGAARDARRATRGTRGDRFMGVATVPLHGVVRSGTTTGTYALSGVKHGDITLTLTFRKERVATRTGSEPRAAPE